MPGKACRVQPANGIRLPPLRASFTTFFFSFKAFFNPFPSSTVCCARLRLVFLGERRGKLAMPRASEHTERTGSMV